MSALAILGVAAVVVPACGGDDGDNADYRHVRRGESAPSAASTTAATGTSTSAPASIGAWEALWEDQRRAAVKRIKDNGWGTSADGTKVTGPEGFTIDLTKCPLRWSNTEGMTDTSIKIGYPLPQSGPARSGGGLAAPEDAVLKHYARRRLQGLHRQDPHGQSRSRGTTATTRRARSPSSTSSSTPRRSSPSRSQAVAPMLKTYDKLNQRCIPQPLPASGHPAVGDPVNHPWTTSASLSYAPRP